MGQIIYREIRPTDIMSCEIMVAKTWEKNLHLKNSGDSAGLASMMLNNMMENANYMEIADKDGEVAGFLLGKTSMGKKTSILETASLYFNSAYKLMFNSNICFHQKTKLMSVFAESENNQKKAMGRMRVDGEVCLFVVDSKHRGFGIGKKLMDRFLEHCKTNHAELVILKTDESCNYGFYDNYGFRRVKTYYDPLVAYEGISPESYLYKILL